MLKVATVNRMALRFPGGGPIVAAFATFESSRLTPLCPDSVRWREPRRPKGQMGAAPVFRVIVVQLIFAQPRRDIHEATDHDTGSGSGVARAGPRGVRLGRPGTT